MGGRLFHFLSRFPRAAKPQIGGQRSGDWGEGTGGLTPCPLDSSRTPNRLANDLYRCDPGASPSRISSSRRRPPRRAALRCRAFASRASPASRGRALDLEGDSLVELELGAAVDADEPLTVELELDRHDHAGLAVRDSAGAVAGLEPAMRPSAPALESRGLVMSGQPDGQTSMTHRSKADVRAGPLALNA